uniref:Protein TPX2 n=1 Tax=Rhabditophanes sp. KR3021 TaxID=114890 RepID=A0AC35U0C9_9BILA
MLSADLPRRPVSATPTAPPEKPKRYYMNLSWSMNDLAVKERQLLELFKHSEERLALTKKNKLVQEKTIDEDEYVESEVSPYIEMTAKSKRNVWKGLLRHQSSSSNSNSYSGESTSRNTIESSIASSTTSAFTSASNSSTQKQPFFHLKNPFHHNRKEKLLTIKGMPGSLNHEKERISPNNLHHQYSDTAVMRPRDYSLPEKEFTDRKRSKSKGIESKILMPIKNSAKKLGNAFPWKSKKSIDLSNSLIHLDVNNAEEINFHSNPNTPLPVSPTPFARMSPAAIMRKRKVLVKEVAVSRNPTETQISFVVNSRNVDEEFNPYSEAFIRRELQKNLDKERHFTRRRSCDVVVFKIENDCINKEPYRERLIV